MFQKALNGEDSQLDKLQEELNRQGESIYDIQVPKGQEPRGLKQAFYYLYKGKIPIPEKGIIIISPELSRTLEQKVKDGIKNTVENLIESESIFKVK